MKKNNRYTFFYGSYSPFSNWHKCTFTDTELIFSCVEQYMMYQKASLFKDDVTAHKIINTKYNPKEYKRLGRMVKNFDQATWDENKFDIVYSGCWFKFNQNKDLKQALLDTAGTELVECNPYDRIWGIGLGLNDLRIYDKTKWKGKNLLGKVLTELRGDSNI